ncbi:MAG TPA: YdcF family protein [Candidatus Saccharimonadales bacterium]|nr:YdcF family protein [Candidatus Saccharimonadales bacterium]
MDKRSDDQLLKIIWDFMSFESPLQHADAIIVGGCKDTGVARYAADLYLTGFAPLIVFSGYQQADMDMSEADLLAGVARQAGVPESAILREHDATNTGENIVLSAALLQNKGITPQSVILVHKPYMSRRFLATAEAQWPSPQPKFVTRHEMISLVEYSVKHGRGEAIRRTLGDFSRMEKYAKKGYQSHHAIPDEVKEAHKLMVWRGHKTG